MKTEITTITQIFNIQETLFTFALTSEAAEIFNDYDKVITGIGKVSAAYALTKAIQHKKPKLIVNLGSAGSNVFAKETVICCNQFVQRDMDVRGLGYAQYETPLSGIDPILQYGEILSGLPLGICGTGDNFEMGHSETVYNVVDMEAHALAFVAMKEEIPFLCLKYISDGADGNAAEDWTVQVHHAAVAFANTLGISQ